MSYPSPAKVTYINRWSNVTETVKIAVDSGYNVVILAFYMAKPPTEPGQPPKPPGPFDMALAWHGADDAAKKEAVEYAHSKGAVVIVAFGGGADEPYGVDAATMGKELGTWAKQHYLDGVDLDLEGLRAGFTGGNMSYDETINWFVTISQAAYDAFGDNNGNKALISHAPQTPYLTTAWSGPKGGYLEVYKRIPDVISHLFIQFYNQGELNPMVTYEHIFEKSHENQMPRSSIKEISEGGIPLHKLILGKLVTKDDGSTGYLEASTIHEYVQKAKTNLGWDAGVMGWQWRSQEINKPWINTIYP